MRSRQAHAKDFLNGAAYQKVPRINKTCRGHFFIGIRAVSSTELFEKQIVLAAFQRTRYAKVTPKTVLWLRTK